MHDKQPVEAKVHTSEVNDAEISHSYWHSKQLQCTCPFPTYLADLITRI